MPSVWCWTPKTRSPRGGIFSSTSHSIRQSVQTNFRSQIMHNINSSFSRNVRKPIHFYGATWLINMVSSNIWNQPEGFTVCDGRNGEAGASFVLFSTRTHTFCRHHVWYIQCYSQKVYRFCRNDVEQRTTLSADSLHGVSDGRVL